MPPTGLSEEQQEIIDLLTGEIRELSNNQCSRVDCLDGDELREVLFELHNQLEHISNALDMAGLSALAASGKLIAANIKALCEDTPEVNELQKTLAGRWGPLFLKYLKNLGQEDHSAVALIYLLKNEAWPLPLTAEKNLEITELFNLSGLDTLLCDEDDTTPEHATSEMCSLLIDKDIRPELLQGLLIELPQQVLQFESSLKRFLDTGKFSDLNQAQRIAHTIKGAANVVAVNGLANLMHFTEGLLENAVKHWQSPPEGFADFLQTLADGLATSAEYLNNLGPEPDNINELMNDLLEWLQRAKHGEKLKEEHREEQKAEQIEVEIDELIDKIELEALAIEDLEEEPSSPEFEEYAQPSAEDANGITLEPAQARQEQTTKENTQEQSPEAPPEIPQETPQKTNSESTKKTTSETSAVTSKPNDDDVRYINLPNHIAQELLRLSGETQIASNQFSVRVENLQNSTQLSDRYHKQIKTLAAEFDALVQTQSALRSASLGSREDQLDPLEMEQFNELHSFSHQLLELTTDSYESILSLQSQLKELSELLYSQQQLNHDSQQILLDINLQPVETFSSRFSRCVRQACRLTKKSAKLEITGAQIMMDSHVLNAIADPIMHILRNAVDHGLESSRAEREQQGKPAEGRIKLSFMNKGDTIVVECHDDGRGLDYDAIYQTALDKQLIQKDSELSPQILNQLVLMPGFSTRKEATQTSGRGIGLDAVMASVRALKGNMQIHSEAHKGCRISITVPSSILTAHAIVIRNKYRNESQSYSLLSRAVEQIIYIRPEQIEHGADGHTHRFNDKNIPVYPLNDLLGYGAGEISDLNALLLCTKTDGSQVFIAVEQIVASQELVIKSLNEYTYLPEGVVGATILGDGTVSPAIDLQELPGMNLDQEALTQLRRRREQLAALDKANYKEPPAALIVDDSLSARRSLAQFVSDLGMDVFTAKDGFDAIQAIEAKKPSLLLVDLEMPRMNGLELTAHLRSREEYKDIPVIMITSRSTDHHKTLAKNAGVNTYLTKPWSEEELMQCIEEQMA